MESHSDHINAVNFLIAALKGYHWHVWEIYSVEVVSYEAEEALLYYLVCKGCGKNKTTVCRGPLKSSWEVNEHLSRVNKQWLPDYCSDWSLAGPLLEVISCQPSFRPDSLRVITPYKVVLSYLKLHKSSFSGSFEEAYSKIMEGGKK